ncbi:MAG: hypothetical protein Kow00105_03900 [Phycisphaeraceae bacterium]
MRIALIFDDGPDPNHTGAILAVCAGQGVRVTFGQVARNACGHPGLVRRVMAAGHEIANHSYSHEHPGELDDAGLRHQVIDAQRAFVDELGVRPAWYWPPYLERDERLVSLTGSVGLRLFDPKHLVVSGDHDRKLPADEIRARALSGVIDGAVILFHEWRDETVRLLPEILTELKERGGEFLTFSEMAAG